MTFSVATPRLGSIIFIEYSSTGIGPLFKTGGLYADNDEVMRDYLFNKKYDSGISNSPKEFILIEIQNIFSILSTKCHRTLPQVLLTRAVPILLNY